MDSTVRLDPVSRPWSRGFGRRLVLVLIPWIVGGLALEGALRFGARLTLRERGQLFDPELGWRPAPNLRKVGPYWSAKVPARTNSRGWRDAEVSLAKPAGIRRIVALGDSFTFGVAVDYGERFTELLERSLPRLEVVNLGVNAFGTDQELRVLELEGIRYAPDVVLLTVFLGNDLDDIRYERLFFWPRPHYELKDGRLRLVRPQLTWDVWLRNASYSGEAGFRLLDRFRSGSRKAECWRTADTVPLFLALVGRMKEVAREIGARLLVVVTGNPPVAADRSRVLDGLRLARIPTLDTQALFEGPGEVRRRLFAADGHWSPAGHRVVGEAIVRELRARRWLAE